MEIFLKQSMEKQPDTFPFIIIGNKADLSDTHRAVGYELLENFCLHRPQLIYRETSAKHNSNVEEAFVEIAKQALIRQETMQEILT